MVLACFLIVFHRFSGCLEAFRALFGPEMGSKRGDAHAFGAEMSEDGDWALRPYRSLDRSEDVEAGPDARTPWFSIHFEAF